MFLIGLRRDRYIDPFGNQREDLPSIRCGRNKLVCRYLDDRCPVYNQHRCRKDSGCKDRLEYRHKWLVKDPLGDSNYFLVRTLVEGSATIEWMSSVSLGARANGLVALDTALGANAASACARVDTLEIEASLGGAALLVLRALGVASGERIAQEVGRARANCAMVLKTKKKFQHRQNNHLHNHKPKEFGD